MKKSGISTRKIALCGVLTAIMLALGYFESLLPVFFGIPGIKLGLSNSVLLFALYLMDAPTAFLLMALKVLLSGLLFGGVSAMAYAFAGGLLSMVSMIVLKKFRFSMIAVSMVGAAMHNVGQVLMAILVTGTPHMVYYMAVLAMVGLGMGALTGIVARMSVGHMKKLGFDGKV